MSLTNRYEHLKNAEDKRIEKIRVKGKLASISNFNTTFDSDPIGTESNDVSKAALSTFIGEEKPSRIKKIKSSVDKRSIAFQGISAPGSATKIEWTKPKFGQDCLDSSDEEIENNKDSWEEEKKKLLCLDPTFRLDIEAASLNLDEKNFEDDRMEEENIKEVENKRKGKIVRDKEELIRTVELINVNVETNKKLIIGLFKKFGKIESVRYRKVPVKNCGGFKINQIMKRSLNPNRTSMSAFVKFSSVEAAKAALELNGTELCGHHIFVKSAVPVTPFELKKDLSKGCTVMIGNLKYDAEEEPLYKHFSHCGKIVFIKVVRDFLRATGIAFIRFQNKEGAVAALRLHNSTVCDNVIRVCKAVRKEKRSKVKKGTDVKANLRKQTLPNHNFRGRNFGSFHIETDKVLKSSHPKSTNRKKRLAGSKLLRGRYGKQPAGRQDKQPGGKRDKLFDGNGKKTDGRRGRQSDGRKDKQFGGRQGKLLVTHFTGEKTNDAKNALPKKMKLNMEERHKRVIAKKLANKQKSAL